ncbi:unnamed protein product, partial [Prorocentrum cordatum]
LAARPAKKSPLLGLRRGGPAPSASLPSPPPRARPAALRRPPAPSLPGPASGHERRRHLVQPAQQVPDQRALRGGVLLGHEGRCRSARRRRAPARPGGDRAGDLALPARHGRELSTKPAAEEQAGAQQWLLSFLRLYPCSHCAEGFMDVCEAMPPTMGSRNEYALWWCEAHNKVSVDHVGNEPRRCDLAQLVSDATRSGMTLDELSSRSAVALSAE